MPETNDPKPDNAKPDTANSDTAKPDTKPDAARADSGLTRAYDRIKSAEEDLARLDRLVSGMERTSEAPRTSHASAAATAAPGHKAPDAKVLSTRSRDQGLRGDRAMMRALVILVIAIGLLGAAVASQYSEEATSIGKSLMARWAPPAKSVPPQASATDNPAQPPVVRLAAADEPSPLPAPPDAKDTDRAPKSGAAAPEPSSPELAQSLKAITSELASISGKLEQLKSSNEQSLREQADTIKQLKAAQEKDAADNARLAAQVQALQTQLSASSASSASATPKPVVRSAVNNDAATHARPRVPAAEPRRPRPPPRGRWMPPYMADPYYADPDW